MEVRIARVGVGLSYGDWRIRRCVCMVCVLEGSLIHVRSGKRIPSEVGRRRERGKSEGIKSESQMVRNGDLAFPFFLFPFPLASLPHTKKAYVSFPD